MPNVHAFQVVPALPESLSCLQSLIYNLHWAWSHEAVELFRRLDRNLWEKTGHNPVRMLGTIPQARLQDAALDDAFLENMDRVCRSNDSYMQSTNTWFRRHHEEVLKQKIRIAYFSMEFGLSECLPIYSGGLGVLAGDHLKSSSDLDVPLVGVGLLYQMGYFRQYLNSDGWQQERYIENDFYNMPLKAERDAEGKPLTVSVDFPGRTVYAQVWKAQVGRIPLYLLDTNISLNNDDDHNITDQLYGGDLEMRLKQEIILGIGGVRALTALGIQPTVCHMNEGHAAFMALERSRNIMLEEKVNFWQAQEASASGNLFTTHTPVPAGFDVFPADLLARYFGAYAQSLGISFEEFMGLGRVKAQDTAEQFNMAVLALKNAHHCNGVSKLHGKVTRRMVQSGFPGFLEEEVPVSSVTNGIHTPSFISREMGELLDRYLGGRWAQDSADAALWAKVDDIPDEEIWRVREQRRERLVVFARARLQQHYEQRGMSDYEIRQAREVLNPNILTIGFARRFATYKRANLVLSDPERITRILTDSQRPVQILFAGKAHPKDDGGKELIRQIVHFAQNNEAIRHRIVFLEDYDMALARHLVQGVDVWLNTPRRPMEASGTSGMKVLPNGGLNFSIPDGWWAEAYDPRVGWSIGKGEEYTDPNYQDKIEANALYDILEKEIVPLFYDRSTEDIPRAWIARIKNSMRTLCPVYNTYRMVSEYTETYYIPATTRYRALTANNLDRAKKLVEWKRRVKAAWGGVKVEKVEDPSLNETATVRVGTPMHIVAYVRLGDLTPQDVVTQVLHGLLDANKQVVNGSVDTLELREAKDGLYRYEGDIPCTTSGLQGFAVRVLPSYSDAELPEEMPLITWE